MKKKSVLTKTLGLVSFICAIALSSCTNEIILPEEMTAEEALAHFARIVNDGRIRELRLVIYIGTHSLTPAPSNVQMLQRNYAHRIEVDGRSLARNVDIFRELDKSILRTFDGDPRINVLLHYTFSTRSGQKIFDIALGGIGSHIMINGEPFHEHVAFNRIFIPFVDEEWADHFRWRVELLEQMSTNP